MYRYRDTPAMAAYALPAVALAFLGLPLYVYLPAHYAELPGIGLAAVGAVLLFARLLDLLTDPNASPPWARPSPACSGSAPTAGAAGAGSRRANDPASDRP